MFIDKFRNFLMKEECVMGVFLVPQIGALIVMFLVAAGKALDYGYEGSAFNHFHTLFGLGWQYWIAFGVLTLVLWEWSYHNFVRDYRGKGNKGFFYGIKIGLLALSAWFSFVSLRILKGIINNSSLNGWLKALCWLGFVIGGILAIAAAIAIIWFGIIKPLRDWNLRVADKYGKLIKPPKKRKRKKK